MPTIPLAPHPIRFGSLPTCLEETLQAISDLCALSIINHHVPHASLLSQSVARHVLTPLRERIYAAPTLNYSERVYDASHHDRQIAHIVYTLLKSILSPPVSLVDAYGEIQGSVQPLEPSSRSLAVVTAIWDDLISLLRAHLFSWLVYGVINDPHAQFFISDAESPAVVPNRLPDFVSSVVAERILFAGNSQRCAILFAKGSNSHPDFVDDRDVFERLMSDPTRAALEIDAASLRWRKSASVQLSKVLPFKRIKDRLYLLRQYLLLGNSAFWRLFFDQLRTKPMLLAGNDFKEEERLEIENLLEQIMVSTLGEMAASDPGADSHAMDQPPFVLKISESGGIYPQFTLSIAESQVLSSRASVYCDIFSVAFSICRVACELRASFGNLQAMDHEMQRKGQSQSIRKDRAGLVGIRELRRRMASVVDGFEWYIQAEVLQPSFDKLFTALDSSSVESHSKTSRVPFFDRICSLHETLMDKVFSQCFVGRAQINTRLNAIFEACFGLCDFVRELSVEEFAESNFSDTVEALDSSFSRNVGLLVRLLSHIQHGSVDSRISALLVRINFNRYVHK